MFSSPVMSQYFAATDSFISHTTLASPISVHSHVYHQRVRGCPEIVVVWMLLILSMSRWVKTSSGACSNHTENHGGIQNFRRASKTCELEDCADVHQD